MNKLSKLAILAVLSTIGTAAAAEDGTITFEGTISDATCTITGGDAQGESESPDFTVHLQPRLQRMDSARAIPHSTLR